MVVADDVSAGPLTELQGGRAVTIAADVREPGAAQQLVDAARDFGDSRIDALFNNAGVSRARPAAEVDDATWSHVMGVNNDAAFHVATAVGRVMIEQGHGAVLNTASVAGTHGLPGNVPYVVSEHAVVALTRALAVEWGVHGIRVNALCPGLTATGMTTRVRGGQRVPGGARGRRPAASGGHPRGAGRRRPVPQLGGSVVRLAPDCRGRRRYARAVRRVRGEPARIRPGGGAALRLPPPRASVSARLLLRPHTALLQGLDQPGGPALDVLLED